MPIAAPHWSRLNWLLLFLAIAIPMGFVVTLPYVPRKGGPPPVRSSRVSRFPASPLVFQQATIGQEPRYRPRIANVQIIDFDKDGLPDILVCDAQFNRVFWYRQSPRGRWEEKPLGD